MFSDRDFWLGLIVPTLIVLCIGIGIGLAI